MILSTPMELASFEMKKTTYASLSRAFDTYRVLEEAMNFSDEDGSGWRIFTTVLRLPSLASIKDREAEAALLAAMIKLSSFELKTYGFGHRLAGMLAYRIHPVSDEACDLILHIGGADLINYPFRFSLNHENLHLYEGYPILHWRLMHIRVAEGLSQVLSKGPDLFRSGFDDPISPQKETPTSLAMYTSWAFKSWRDGLISAGVDVEKFIEQELEKNQLVHTGWINLTLRNLFLCDHSGYKSTWHIWERSKGVTDINSVYCSDCAKFIYFIAVQPHWRHRLERIRQGLDPDTPVQDEYEANDAELTGFAISTSSLGSPNDLADETYGIEDGALDSDTVSSSDADPELAQRPYRLLRGDPHGYPKMVSLLAECVYCRHEFICMECWLHYVRTGTRGKTGRWKRGYPAWAVSHSSSTDSFTSDDESLDPRSAEDEASEDEFSPYLIHT